MGHTQKHTAEFKIDLKTTDIGKFALSLKMEKSKKLNLCKHYISTKLVTVVTSAWIKILIVSEDLGK